MFICRQKMKFIFHGFLEILQRYCKLVLGTLGMHSYIDQNWYYQLVENFRVYLQAYNQLHPPSPHVFSGYIVKICKVLILGTLGMPGCTHPCLVAHTQNDSINLQKTLMFICMPKINFIISFFLEILHFKESCNLMADSILAHNSKTRILPDMKLVVNIKNNITFHFRLFPRKTDKIFQKIQKTLFRGHFLIFSPKFGQKLIFLEKGILSVFR